MKSFTPRLKTASQTFKQQIRDHIYGYLCRPYVPQDYKLTELLERLDHFARNSQKSEGMLRTFIELNYLDQPDCIALLKEWHEADGQPYESTEDYAKQLYYYLLVRELKNLCKLHNLPNPFKGD